MVPVSVGEQAWKSAKRQCWASVVKSRVPTTRPSRRTSTRATPLSIGGPEGRAAGAVLGIGRNMSVPLVISTLGSTDS